ncbi:MAG: hypothetical protein GY694_07760 [Gammaproteobacteria bacterium]|nr:hypothetical protein [Gammaproteobacteria bacterium]
MSVLIASTTNAAQSSGTDIDAGASITVIATKGIASNEEAVIEVATSTDTWTPSGEVLSRSQPIKIITGGVTFRINKPASVVPYAIEIDS